MDRLREVRYRCDSRSVYGLFSALFLLVRDSIYYKDLIKQLILRDLVNKYKKSLLGVVWHFITPLIAIASWMLLNHSGVLNPGEVGVPYPVYVLMGTTLWSTFVLFFEGASGTLQAGKSFINQVCYPHHILLTKQILEAFISSLIPLALTYSVAIYSGVSINLWYLILPLSFIPLALLASSVGVIVSLFGAGFEDVTKAFRMGIGFVFYLVPIVYSKNSIESQALSKVIEYNPLSYLITVPRDLVLGVYSGGQEVAYLLSVFIALALFVFSFRFFFLAEMTVVEKLQ